MPAIPEFVLRKLYIPDSLKAMEGGFSFELNNTFAPVTLIGMGLNVDDIPCDPGDIYLELPDLGEIPAGGISLEQPFNLAVNMVVKVNVFADLPKKRLVIRTDTREAGVLQFGVPVSVAEEVKPVNQKKPGLFDRFNRRVQYAARIFRAQQDPQHPIYHYAPPANWMNDPNGLIYWKGCYHLFFQYNPVEPVWGNIHWGHASSKDLLHWKHQPIALWPDPKGADAGGCFSGSAVDNHGTPTIFYTGVYPEVQCRADGLSDDLQFWKKYEKPVIPTPPDGMQIEGFRDPFVWREATEWRMIVGSGLTDVGGAVLLYRSKDLLEWQYLGMLFHDEDRPDKALRIGSMWECPTFFPLGEKWVLTVSVYSADGGLYSIYYTGKYHVDRFIPEGPPRLVDAGISFYAPQTFVDKKGRRVMMGWLREARNTAEQIDAGWSGAMSLPRCLSLSKKGELCSTPIEAIQTLRSGHEILTKTYSLSDSVRGSNLEILIRIPPDAEKWSGVHLDCGTGTQSSVLIGVDCANSAVVVDCRHAGGLINLAPVELSGTDELTLHAFVDGSVIEVFVEDKLPLSARFYMEKPQNLRVRLVGEASADLWKMKI